MFETFEKLIAEVHEKDEEKIQRRKSKRISVKLELGAEKNELNTQNTKQRSSVESEIEEDDEDLLEGRPKWDNDYISTLYLVAFAVGGANFWRFGFLCFQNGGLVFLIPYTFFNIVCALPCMYLELLVGQYTQVGVIATWKIVPIFKGVGMCMVLLSYISCFNVQSILAWSLFYAFQAAFHRPLPWISCDNGFGKKSNGHIDKTVVAWDPELVKERQDKNWHTENCTEFSADYGTDEILKKNQRLPGTEYFRGRVQRMWKSGYEDKHLINISEDNGKTEFGFGSNVGIIDYNLDTSISLVAVFVIITLCTMKGIKFSSNMMAFLTLSPYILLMLLFYRATGLSGAWAGLGELFQPDFSKLFVPDAWWKCAEQVIFSTGTGFGIHLTTASHNHFQRKVVYDAVLAVAVNIVTSLLSACTIFMFLGHVKVAVNKDIKDLVSSGAELVFEVMPDVLGVLARANFYAFCFYLFLFLLVLTTVTTVIICSKSAYLEVLPVTIKYKVGARIMFVGIVYTISFIASGLNLTRGGLHTFSFIETFAALHSFMLTSILFLIGITWCFGLREIIDASEAMKIRAPGMYFQICWKFVSPIVFLVVFLARIFDPDSYRVRFNEKIIPLDGGLYAIGFTLALGPFVAVIGAAIHVYWKAPGKDFKQKLLICISPTTEHAEILETGTGKRAKLSHYLYLYASTPDNKCNIFCHLRKHKVSPEVTPATEEEGGVKTIPAIEVESDNQPRFKSVNEIIQLKSRKTTTTDAEIVSEKRKSSGSKSKWSFF